VSCGVADGRGQEFQVPVVRAGEGIAKADGKAFGDAGGEGEDAAQRGVRRSIIPVTETVAADPNLSDLPKPREKDRRRQR
jgi:hypothetical protein